MKKALLITFTLAFISFVSVSQEQLFSYTFSVDTISNTEDSKDVLTAIVGNNPKVMNKRIIGNHRFSVESTINNSEEVLKQHLNSLGYELTSFSKTLKQEYYYTSKTEPGGTDCGTASIVCTNDAFNGTATDFGTQELSASNDGCLSGENQSSWYYVNIDTGGTLTMLIDPTNNNDDYDFAIWGPYTPANAAANCPPTTLPTRCSYSSLDNLTGLRTGDTDVSEGVGGNSYVAPLNATAGEVYIIVIDNYSTSGDPYGVTWGGTATLDCTPIVLPVEVSNFDGENIENANRLKWSTASEYGNDYFIIERSTDKENWTVIDNQAGAGFSDSDLKYYYDDYNFRNTLNYYRLSQVDFNGDLNRYKIITIDNTLNNKHVVRTINMLGQEVSEDFTGARIIVYSDGSKIRKIGN